MSPYSPPNRSCILEFIITLVFDIQWCSYMAHAWALNEKKVKRLLYFFSTCFARRPIELEICFWGHNPLYVCLQVRTYKFQRNCEREKKSDKAGIEPGTLSIGIRHSSTVLWGTTEGERFKTFTWVQSFTLFSLPLTPCSMNRIVWVTDLALVKFERPKVKSNHVVNPDITTTCEARRNVHTLLLRIGELGATFATPP